MKHLPGFKQVLLPAIFLFLAACLFVSCFNKSDAKIIPGKYDPSGNGTGTTGTTTGSSGTTTGDSTNTSLFSSPSDVAVDATGNLYVADYGNNRIEKITPGGVVTTLAGNGTIGAINGAGNLASFNGPSGVAVDLSGNVYVADSRNNLIRKITPAGLVSTLAGTLVVADSTSTANIPTGPAFFGPSGVAVDASGNVYVADAGDNQIRMITPSGAVSTLAGSGIAGANDGTAANATFNNPTGVAVDASGNVYVTDFLNSLIRKVTPGGVVTTIAGRDTTGSTDGADTVATFYFPNSLAVDASGNIYVTDDINNLVREVTPAGVTTIAGSGMQGYANGLGRAASFNDPAGIAVDASGNLYVADANNNLIRKINPAGMISTVAGVPPGIGASHAAKHIYYHTGTGQRNRRFVHRKLQ